MQEFRVQKLHVHIGDSTAEMAAQAADHVAMAFNALDVPGMVNMMFAGAESQRDFQAALASRSDLDWGRIHAFNVDDYWDPDMDPRYSVGACLWAYLYDAVRPARVDGVNPTASDAEVERARYEGILAAHTLHMACIGIGESGHLGLNEPGQTRFDDKALVRVVRLPHTSLAQLEQDAFLGGAPIPRKGITTTIPKLIEAGHIIVVVPFGNKAEIVARVLRAPVSESLPATVLKTHPDAHLYLDPASAALI